MLLWLKTCWGATFLQSVEVQLKKNEPVNQIV